MTWLVQLARVGAAALIILLGETGEAAAQRALERSGFFIGLGLGYGSLDLTCGGVISTARAA